HKDHVSGFGSQRAAFEAFTVDHAWAAWTEDPHDCLAQKVKRHQNDLESSLTLASNALVDEQAPFDEEFKAIGSGVRELLGFRGDLPADRAPLGADFAKTVNEAMKYATTRGTEPTEYLCPGTVIERPWLPGVRVYALGPPRSEEALTVLGE